MNAVCRTGWLALLAPVPTCGLAALEAALAGGDPRLLTGATVRPSPVGEAADCAPEAACPLGFALWEAWGLRTAREVDAEFGVLCARVSLGGERIDGKAPYIVALNALDESPRAPALAALLPLVREALAGREGGRP